MKGDGESRRIEIGGEFVVGVVKEALLSLWGQKWHTTLIEFMGVGWIIPVEGRGVSRI